MCDQLRFDYLSCFGNSILQTPNIDSIARKGTLFQNAYVQSPVCASSRASYYTGRYVDSHEVWWNDFPLPIDVLTLGDYTKENNIRNVLIGKSHATANKQGLKRLGIQNDSDIGRLISEQGFENYARHDGLYRDGYHTSCKYYDFLKSLGYTADNPWHDNANSAVGQDNDVLSGWLYENNNKPANIKDEHSETAFITQEAMRFMEQMQGQDQSWICHLSYIKPHWPYMVCEPYFSMYKDCLIPKAKRSAIELDWQDDLLKAYRLQPAAKTFQNEEVRKAIIPTYMALIKQIDDHLGKLFTFMKRNGLEQNTMIIFTSDHGDYLGDHFMGEKDFFHQEIIKNPLLIYDPSLKKQPSEIKELVEAVDIIPTILDYYNIDKPAHVLEGRSLYHLLQGDQVGPWRDCVFCEYDYSMMAIRMHLSQPVDQCRIYMVFDGRYKYIKPIGYNAILFDLQQDQNEFKNIAKEREDLCKTFEDKLHHWLLRNNNHTSFSYQKVQAYKQVLNDIPIGYWDQKQMDDDIVQLKKLFGNT